MSRNITIPERHGTQRNQRTETTTSNSTFLVPGGSIELPMFSLTETVSERWCEVDKEWVETRGIMGALLCPKCHTPWKGEYHEHS